MAVRPSDSLDWRTDEKKDEMKDEKKEGQTEKEIDGKYLKREKKE